MSQILTGGLGGPNIITQGFGPQPATTGTPAFVFGSDKARYTVSASDKARYTVRGGDSNKPLNFVLAESG